MRRSLVTLLLAASFALPLVVSALATQERDTLILQLVQKVLELNQKTIALGGTAIQVPPGLVALAQGQGSGGSTGAATPSCTIERTLAIGSRGEDVRCLQSFLITQNLLAPDSATGYFGPLTRAAVVALQTSRGLEPVGHAGKLTRAIVNGANSAPVLAPIPALPVPPAPQQPPPPVTPPVSGGGGGNGGALPPPTPSPLVSCTFNDQTIATGQSFIAYQSSSVSAGQQCVSEMRTCTNGILSGSYTNASCAVSSASAPPIIYSAAPTSGPPGTQVTITGTGFTPTGNIVGISNDYMQLFDDNAPWANAAAHVQVFELPLNIEKFPDSALKKIIMYVNKHNIALAIAVPMLKVSNTCPINEGASNKDYLRVAQRIARLGGTVQYVVGDQPLFTGLAVCKLSISATAQQVAMTANSFKTIFPNVKILQTEPVANSGWPGDVTAQMAEYLADFRADFGQPLAGVQFDIYWREPGHEWKTPVGKLIRYLKTIGQPIQVIYNSDSVATSDTDWLTNAKQNYQNFESAFGLPNSVIFESWNQFPFRALPETSPVAFTHLIDQYVEAHPSSLPEIWFVPLDAFDAIWAAGLNLPSSNGNTVTFTIPSIFHPEYSAGPVSLFAVNGSYSGYTDEATGFSNDSTFVLTGALSRNSLSRMILPSVHGSEGGRDALRHAERSHHIERTHLDAHLGRLTSEAA